MQSIIAFAGGMGAGKDRYGELLREMVSPFIDAEKYSFATPVRKELDTIIEMVLKKNKSYYQISKIMKVPISDAKKIGNLIKNEYRNNGRKMFSSYDRTKGVREMLQFWGTDVRRKQNEDYWVSIAEREIKERVDKGFLVYITDARFLNEFESIKNIYGSIIYLKADRKTREERIRKRDGSAFCEKTFNHKSERDFEVYQNFDGMIDTDKYTPEEGIERLKEIIWKD